jgi:hypothetical protein
MVRIASAHAPAKVTNGCASHAAWCVGTVVIRRPIGVPRNTPCRVPPLTITATACPASWCACDAAARAFSVSCRRRLRGILQLAGVRNIGLDDPSSGCSDLHCNFGDRSIRGMSSGGKHAAQVPHAGRTGGTVRHPPHSSEIREFLSFRRVRFASARTGMSRGGAEAHFCVGYLLQSSVSITMGQVRRKSRRRSRHRP